jgi:hypothetical protein
MHSLNGLRAEDAADGKEAGCGILVSKLECLTTCVSERCPGRIPCRKQQFKQHEEQNQELKQPQQQRTSSSASCKQQQQATT